MVGRGEKGFDMTYPGYSITKPCLQECVEVYIQFYIQFILSRISYIGAHSSVFTKILYDFISIGGVLCFSCSLADLKF